MKTNKLLSALVIISAAATTSSYAGNVDDRYYDVTYNNNPSMTDCFSFKSGSPGNLKNTFDGDVTYAYDDNNSSLVHWQAAGGGAFGYKVGMHGYVKVINQRGNIKITEISGDGILESTGETFTFVGKEKKGICPISIVGGGGGPNGNGSRR